MAVFQGACPSCGAPISFDVGASAAQVCRYCKSVVVRTDRDLQNLGRVADLTPTTSPVAVGDEGAIEGRTARVMGRVQYDHGAGPWDEWYVAFQDGSWAWLAYAQGNYYLTYETALPGPVPSWGSYAVEQDVRVGSYVLRVKEHKHGRVVSGEGELPVPVTPGQDRCYVDLTGPENGFATLDFGAGQAGATPHFFVGRQVAEAAIELRQTGERPVHEVGTAGLTCPSCGGNVPALAPNRSERLACPYCGVISDIPTRRALAKQEAARAAPEIPLGSRGTFGGASYVLCGYVERSATIEGESFTWQEYLLFGAGVGFRWLVKDESTWEWVSPVNPSDLDISAVPRQVGLSGNVYRLRNHNAARVDYVLGEFYWKVEAGETVDATDFAHGGHVLSREASGDEVNWSYAEPVAWSVVASSFGLPEGGGGGAFPAPSMGGGSASGPGPSTTVWVIIILVVVVILMIMLCANGGGGGGSYGGGTFGGSTRGGK